MDTSFSQCGEKREWTEFPVLRFVKLHLHSVDKLKYYQVKMIEEQCKESLGKVSLYNGILT